MRRREAASKYRQIAKELSYLHSGACEHISRKDNNQVFDIYHFLKEVADRIAKGYPSTEYGYGYWEARRKRREGDDAATVEGPPRSKGS